MQLILAKVNPSSSLTSFKKAWNLLKNQKEEILELKKNLHQAADDGDSEMLEYLLENGTKITQDELGRTPLHLAIANENCLSWLIAYGADVNLPDKLGRTALHEAAK